MAHIVLLNSKLHIGNYSALLQFSFHPNIITTFLKRKWWIILSCCEKMIEGKGWVKEPTFLGLLLSFYKYAIFPK